MRKLFVIFLLCTAAFAQANSVTLVKTKPTSATQYTSFFTVSYFNGTKAAEVWFSVVSNNSDSANTVQTATQNAAIQALSGVGVTAAATDIAMPVMQRGTTALGWNDIWGKPSTFTPSAHTHLWGEITNPPPTYAPSTHGRHRTILRCRKSLALVRQ
jgi:hypothetical protein